jgi:streptomycin 6-kinase
MLAMSSFPMPQNLAEAVNREADERREWAATLPETVPALVRRWSLELGDPFQPGGHTAWVAPARTKTGANLVLKVAWHHTEAEHEPDGLRVWDGQGTVRLHTVEQFDDTVALLLERCVPGHPLTRRPEAEQDTVIASLLPRLWRDLPSDHPFRSLEAICQAWADSFEAKTATRPTSLDPGLAREGIALFRTLPTTAARHVLLCTDLHAGNVLAAKREPWLVIDPKPYVGDPTYDPLQHILNCEERLHADPRSLARRMADLLDLDADRLLLWLFARCVQGSAEFPDLAHVARLVAPT